MAPTRTGGGGGGRRPARHLPWLWLLRPWPSSAVLCRHPGPDAGYGGAASPSEGVGTGNSETWAALGDPWPWQDQPPGPSGQDGETEAWMGGVIHSRPLSPQEPCLGRSQECWVPAWEESLGSAAMRRGLPPLPGSKWPQAPHRNCLPVPFQEGAQGCKEVDGGRVDKIPLCGSQALFCFCHLDQCLS